MFFDSFVTFCVIYFKIQCLFLYFFNPPEQFFLSFESYWGYCTDDQWSIGHTTYPKRQLTNVFKMLTRLAARLVEVQPVLEVVAKVVTHKRSHRHRVVHYLLTFWVNTQRSQLILLNNKWCLTDTFRGLGLSKSNIIFNAFKIIHNTIL